jgi:citrate lyase alpha subunit
MTIGTIALVVGVFVALMALANGLNIALRATGSPENLIILRQGSQTEMQSGVSKEAFQIIQTLPGIAREAVHRTLEHDQGVHAARPRSPAWHL